MKELYDLRDMISDEIKKLTKKSELTTTDIELVYKMIDILKDINEICGQSGMGGYSMNGGQWQANGSYGYMPMYNNSYARNRDSMGRYARNDGYSRESANDDMIAKLERMISETSNENQRRILQDSINRMR